MATRDRHPRTAHAAARAPGSLQLESLPANTLKLHYGDWLATFPWSHMITLTSKRWMSQWTMAKIFRDTFIRRAERLAQRAVPYFMVIEGGALDDRPHIHAVVSGLEGIPRARIGKLWEHGRKEVQAFDPARGACWYITKEIGDRELNFDLSRAWFPGRRWP